ncbi:hypothetical protein RYX36_034704, partial [Vicia faba]
EGNTDVNFVLDDGTGRIKCRRWVNESFDTKEMEEVLDGMYFRVYGNLKRFQGVKQLGAFSVRPVTNFDEILFHFIDCIHNHLRTKVKLEGTPSTYPPTNLSMNTPVKSALNGSQAPSNPEHTQYSTDGLKDCDKLVINYLQQHSNMLDERGIHVEELAKEFHGRSEFGGQTTGGLSRASLFKFHSNALPPSSSASFGESRYHFAFV